MDGTDDRTAVVLDTISRQLERLQATADTHRAELQEHRAEVVEQTRRIDADVSALTAELRTQGVRLLHLEGAADVHSQALRDAHGTLAGQLETHSAAIRALQADRQRGEGRVAGILLIASALGSLAALGVSAGSLYLGS